jgi:hypothetical protein
MVQFENYSFLPEDDENDASTAFCLPITLQIEINYVIVCR